MSTHKYFDRICLLILVAALVLTLLFMNGESLGITKIIDEDSETHEDSQSFTSKDLDGSWDSSSACLITLNGSDGKITGNGAYMQDGNLVIVSAGDYSVSGNLSDGSIVIASEKNAKIRLLLNGISLNCSDDACIRVNEADKVFLTLAEGTENQLVSGSDYSETALADSTDGVIFAHDDLTINGSGSLTISGGNAHGIAANDNLTITGGIIQVSALEDGLHANDHLNICNASISIDCQDDAIHADESVYIESGSIAISNCYEGIEATTVEIAGGDIDIVCTDDGINASNGNSSEGGFAFGGKEFASDQFKKQGISENSSNQAQEDDSMMPPELPQGDESMMPSELPQGDDSMMPPELPQGDESANQQNMQRGMHGDRSGMHEKFRDGSIMPDNNGSMNPLEIPDNNGSTTPPEMPDNNGSMNPPEMPDNSDSPKSSEPTDKGDAKNSDESEETPLVLITGGKITITNTQGRDADGIDSNGDILINGGEVYIQLNGTSSGNCTLDYGSENGGICQINGGIVVAAGGSSMIEEIDSSSSQPSVTLFTSAAASTVTVTDSNGNVLLTYEIPTDFTALTLSCPEFTVGASYTVTIGDSVESITLEQTAGSYGNQNMGGRNFNGRSFGNQLTL